MFEIYNNTKWFLNLNNVIDYFINLYYFKVWCRRYMSKCKPTLSNPLSEWGSLLIVITPPNNHSSLWTNHNKYYYYLKYKQK